MKGKKSAPKKTRNLEKTRKEILGIAFLEVFKHGFQGVSIDQIVAKTNLTKGALFHQFPTKMDLGYALVDEVVTPMILDRWIRPLDDYANPLEGILAQMKKLIGESDPQYRKLGCPLNNLVQEMAPIDAGFKKRLQKAVRLWIDETERHLVRGKRDGYLKKEVDTGAAAHFVVMAHEGFYGLIKGLDDLSAFTALYKSLKTYFQTLSTRSL